MLSKIVNLTLILVLQEIDYILEQCPDYPYKLVFSSSELRQKLINHILEQIPNYYAIVEDNQELPEDFRCLYASVEERLSLIILICNSMVDICEENAELISFYLTQGGELDNKISVWVG